MKKRTNRYIAISLLLTGMVLPVIAQTLPQNPKIINEQVVRADEDVVVSFELQFDDVNLRSNDMVIYTPILLSEEKDYYRAELPPVVVAGNKRSKILQRRLVLDKEIPVTAEPYSIVTKKKNRESSVNYSLTLPYRRWMEGSKLLIKTEVMGCADCSSDGNDIVVATNLLPKKVMPTFTLTFIEPEVEAVKARSDSHTATFNFPVNRYELNRDYKNNSAKLDEVDLIISEIAGDDNVEITKFTIDGYASPEGSATHNKMLAERRADAFANYLSAKFNVDKQMFAVGSHGEDWEGLRQAVEASSLTDRDEILKIIETVDNPDGRDTPLIKLSNGTTYRRLIDEFYPPLRRTEYSIAYLVRSFDIEEAKEVIKTNPKLLSLNEMYLVAQSYGASSPQFKEVFDIAARLYPDSDIALMNSAAADIENGAFDSAIQRLEKLNDASKGWNNLGVAHIMRGDYEKARQYFARAAESGDSDAKRNQTKLDQFLK